MSQLLDLRAAVIDAIGAALPGFKVEGHLGRFTAEDLSRFLMTAPAARVAVLGLSDTIRTLEPVDEELDEEVVEGVARLAIYVVTADGPARLSRDEAALAAVERIVKLASGARWGLDFTLAARAPTASNLFSAETLAKGRALWAIDLPQPLRLYPDGFDQVPEGTLRELFVGVAPEIGAAHVDDYIGPLPEPAAESGPESGGVDD